MIRRIYILFFCIILFSNITYPDKLYKKIERAGKSYFNFVRSGKDKDLKNSIKIMENLKKNYPDNNMVRVLTGRIYLQKASNSFWFWNKYKWAYRGIKLQDKAVELSDNNIFVLYTRAIGCLRLPDFFNRLKKGENDFKKIAKIIERKKISYTTRYWREFRSFHSEYSFEFKVSSNKLEKDFRQRCYYMLAVLYNRLNKKNKTYKYINETLKVDQKSKWSIFARILYKNEGKKLYLKK